MSNRIQRVPPGYLSFLAMRGTGVAPTEAPDQLQPVVNLEHLYVAGDLVSVETVAGALANAGDSAQVNIPQGEAWRVVAFGYSVTYSAIGGVGSVAIRVSAPGSLSVPIGSRDRFVATATTDRFDNGVLVPQPWVLIPGSRIQATLQEAVGTGTVTLTMRVLFHRLRV